MKKSKKIHFNPNINEEGSHHRKIRNLRCWICNVPLKNVPEIQRVVIRGKERVYCYDCFIEEFYNRVN